MKTILSLLILAISSVASAAESARELQTQNEQVIQPEIERRDIVIPKIDTENFEIGAYTGQYNMEDFGANTVSGFRATYHITERAFIEGAIGSTEISDTTFRSILPGGLFPNEIETLEYNYVVIGYNLFPGEFFPWEGVAWTSSFYVVAGAGNTTFVDKDHSTLILGSGFRILPQDWLAIHMDVRRHSFESDITGTTKVINNIEITLGLSIYF
ncbi:hypothetical protein MNBD_GAMMA23-219 [hydrothermal vent metagenome]|uniref:Outer membrane beta-barrel domain-containing protein n=1 Tax=hydrothermal vent metagenome TaxID=652676 RepID=A0A3B1AHM5_9ZZZZ